MRSARRFNPVLLAPIVALALISFTVRFFAPVEGFEEQLMNEVGWLWWPICTVGLAAVWFGRERPGIAMFSLVPLWGLALLALNLGVLGAQKVGTNCSPASREFIAILSMGETYGIYVLAFAWSAALSLCCAAATLRERRKGEAGLAASLLLTGFSFVAATLHAGVIHFAMTEGLSSVAILRRAAADTNTIGALTGWLIFAGASVAILAAWRPQESRRRLGLLSAFTSVPLIVWALALEGRAPMVAYLEKASPRALRVDGLSPVERKAPLLTTPDAERDASTWFESSRVEGLRVGDTFGADALWRVFRMAHAAGTTELELNGVRGNITPLPFAGLERRFDLAVSATWVRLRRSEPCTNCDVTVHLEGSGLRAMHRDGSSEFWEREKLDESMQVKRLPGAEWVTQPLSNQALVDASLIALSHGHVLVLQVR